VSIYEPIAVELTDEERLVLRWGLIEWGGPARATEEMAVALGFGGVRDLLDVGYRIADDIEARRSLPQVDWARAMLATEVAFASDVMGSGSDWIYTVGLGDAETIAIIRSLQRKVPWGRVFGVAFGTTPE